MAIPRRKIRIVTGRTSRPVPKLPTERLFTIGGQTIGVFRDGTVASIGNNGRKIKIPENLKPQIAQLIGKRVEEIPWF
ncbi:MAG: hypothetical protein AABW99_04825 [archaeon]